MANSTRIGRLIIGKKTLSQKARLCRSRVYFASNFSNGSAFEKWSSTKVEY